MPRMKIDAAQAVLRNADTPSDTSASASGFYDIQVEEHILNCVFASLDQSPRSLCLAALEHLHEDRLSLLDASAILELYVCGSWNAVPNDIREKHCYPILNTFLILSMYLGLVVSDPSLRLLGMQLDGTGFELLAWCFATICIAIVVFASLACWLVLHFVVLNTLLFGTVTLGVLCIGWCRSWKAAR
ncbi:hypothetical protein EK21DRAFT_85640 [Setomelanomma holmii]|uniref:Uncharacterized protein n=1 Tax=Setomelanomma holmii TaxID=210430 RepID=A0A9P4HGU1_9PLEO|nr:hypothetical protein EK21DRAFT_85640 [Setomelanomma holmii]